MVYFFSGAGDAILVWKMGLYKGWNLLGGYLGRNLFQPMN